MKRLSLENFSPISENQLSKIYGGRHTFEFTDTQGGCSTDTTCTERDESGNVVWTGTASTPVPRCA